MKLLRLNFYLQFIYLFKKDVIINNKIHFNDLIRIMKVATIASHGGYAFFLYAGDLLQMVFLRRALIILHYFFKTVFKPKIF